MARHISSLTGTREIVTTVHSVKFRTGKSSGKSMKRRGTDGDLRLHFACHGSIGLCQSAPFDAASEVIRFSKIDGALFTVREFPHFLFSSFFFFESLPNQLIGVVLFY